MAIRLGDVMVRLGLLSEAQRDEALETQRASGRPFGVVAEELFDVSPREVERAWAAQYRDITGQIDLAGEPVDSEAVSLLDRRQAWQFQVLPLREERGELVVATTEESLPRAMRFAAWKLGQSCSFVVADNVQFVQHLTAHYPMAGAGDALESLRRSA